MSREEQLGVRVPPDLKAALVAEAKLEDRSLASLVERILRDWLTARSAVSLHRPKQ